jgi:hypothetical protein
MMPKNHSEVMHGKVRGGDVPLYLTGCLNEFMSAGLILPDLGGYVRAEWDVMDIGADGKLSPSKDEGSDPLAQMAIPRLVSSFKLDEGLEMRRAEPPDTTVSEPIQTDRYALNEPTVPTSSPTAISATIPSPSLRHYSIDTDLISNSYFDLAAIP